jgi:hypothetical protein
MENRIERIRRLRRRYQGWKDAANLYRSGIELDSLNEGLYRGLMLCHSNASAL